MDNSINSCDFCDINTIEAQKITDTNEVIVLLPRKPVTEGHVIVITKRHIQYITELSEIEFLSMQDTLKKMIEVFGTFMHSSGFHVMNNNGKSADQHINHVHFHIFFRNTEGVRPFNVLSKKISRQELSIDEWNYRLASLRKFTET